MMEKMREEFEAWYEEMTSYPVEFGEDGNPSPIGGPLSHNVTLGMWVAWKASRAAQRGCDEMTVFKQIEQWANDRNLIEGATRQAQFMKLAEELGEVAECLAKGLPLDELKKEIGDMIVVLTILAAQSGTDVEACAVAAYDKIKHRTGRMVDGVFIKDGD